MGEKEKKGMIKSKGYQEEGSLQQPVLLLAIHSFTLHSVPVEPH